MPVTYHGTAVEVLVGDHVEFKVWISSIAVVIASYFFHIGLDLYFN